MIGAASAMFFEQLDTGTLIDSDTGEQIGAQS